MGQGKLGFDLSKNPTANEESEVALRRELLALAGIPHQEACDRVIALDQGHAQRRQWPWAKLGESPLALALEPLARLAKAARVPIGGASIKDMVEAFASEGWRCDAAALDALANTKPPAVAAAIASAVRALYAPWLESAAQRFQALVSQNDIGLRGLVRGISGEKEACVLFVDGLRFDVGGNSFWFSYKTLIAFQKGYSDIVVYRNDWSTTTGKHLNAIDDGDKKKRLSAADFEAAFVKAFGQVTAQVA